MECDIEMFFVAPEMEVPFVKKQHIYIYIYTPLKTNMAMEHHHI